MDNLYKLKETITDKDSTATELAEAIGVTRHQIRRWINGESEMGIWKLKKICEYYNVSADYILSLNPNMDWPRGKGEKRYSSDCTKYIFLYVINAHLLVITNASAHPGVRCKGFGRPGLRCKLAMGRLALALTARISLHRLRALRRSLTKAEENSITNKRRKAGLSACFFTLLQPSTPTYRKSL